MKKEHTYRVVTEGRKTTVTRRKILDPEGKGTISKEDATKAAKRVTEQRERSQQKGLNRLRNENERREAE
jgi:hypothetical protein